MSSSARARGRLHDGRSPSAHSSGGNHISPTSPFPSSSPGDRAMTRVRIPPTLREQVSGEREVVAEGNTVRELLDDLMDRFPALRPQLVEDGDLAPFV